MRFALRSAVLAGAMAATAQAAPPGFNREIRPILSDNCFHCHGPDAKHRKGGLRLDLREEALKPAESGKPAIVPGKPGESELIARLFAEDRDDLMPPADSHKTLTDAQKKLLEIWITEGAPYEAHWAYATIARPAVPAITDARARVANPVDAFVQEPILRSGFAPAPAADPATLLRRLSLDLTGLPPAPDQVASFERDPSDAAYAAAVDRLLSSPHHGERMAQHWLDVVRYADTVGFHGDQNHNAWAYRDWVVDAFNANMPFDRFTIEQLAGDLLPDPSDAQWTATCFNRLTMMTREGGAQPGEYLAKYTADRVRTVGMAWLGATVGCAECHDHKFDPWTTKDFYSLGAYFADVKQWGVYNDYAYTPNPDLRGWSNDHPFPPERMVVSPALVEKIARLEADAGRLLEAAARELAADPGRLGAFESWRAGTSEFLDRHPTGWHAPPPSVTEQGAESAVAPDGLVTFAPGPARDATLEIPLTGDLTAIRIELLPDKPGGGSVVRQGHSVRLEPQFQQVDAAGTARPIAMHFSEADRKRPRYANGLEIAGLRDGWTSQDGSAHLPHTAVWLFDRPLGFSTGERLRIVLPKNLAASLRVSVSPVITRIQFEAPPHPLADLPTYLRVTTTLTRSIDAAILACRDGRAPVMVTEKAANPLTIRVLARGNWQDDTGEVCPPATPHFLPRADGPPDRLGLARWLVSRNNPLTARVIMNRLWRQFFGTGLSAQVDDLGAQGEAPSHPELLDWLAAEFMESGWNVRRMTRLIVTSHTYRQSAQPRQDTRALDPQNRWLASQNARRLEAETVRDTLLAVAGLLDPTRGGPPVKPYQPENYYAGLQFPDRTYVPDTGAAQYRRGLYTHWQRTFLHPMLANFDAPSREDCVAVRTASNTPQQALTLLNDTSYVEAARAWAERLTGEDTARIDTAFKQALARPPTADELAGLVTFLIRMRGEYAQRPEDARRLVATGQRPAPAGDPVELAAWTSVCRVLLNLHETITRY
jgi:hypothetical protein